MAYLAASFKPSGHRIDCVVVISGRQKGPIHHEELGSVLPGSKELHLVVALRSEIHTHTIIYIICIHNYSIYLVIDLELDLEQVVFKGNEMKRAMTCLCYSSGSVESRLRRWPRRSCPYHPG